MEYLEYIILLLTLILFISFVYYKKTESYENFTEMNDNFWSRNKCKYTMNKTLENQLKKYNIVKNDDKWNLYIPCSYDNPTKEIKEMPVKKNGKYFIIDNIDNMIAKEWLWKNMVKHHGIKKTETLMPKSYVLNNDGDIDKFLKDYNNNKIYIMKKNIQRQNGLKITNDKIEILNGKYKDFKLAQELLQNPYLINGRKINLRCYVLTICNNNKINVYNYKDGFMYYTPKLFVKNSLDRDVNITTGYIDRKVYEENPLTHQDFRLYLDDEKRNLSGIEKYIRERGMKISSVCFNRINELIKNIFESFVGIICKTQKFKHNNTLFELFGIDVAIDEDLNCMVMEVNKGPDMGAKDKRDSELKHKVIRDVFRLVGLAEDNEEENGFVNVMVENNVFF